MFKLGEKEMMMTIRDMKRNSDFETLWSEIPQTPPFLNLRPHSPMNRVSPSPSSSFSNGFSLSEESSPFEDQPHHQQPKFHHYGLWLGSKSLPDSHYGNKNVNEKELVGDGFGLCENLYQMHIRDEEKDREGSGQIKRFERDTDGFGFSFGDVSSYNGEKYGSYEGFNRGFQSSPQQVSMCFDGNDVIRSSLLGFQGGYEKGDSLGSYSISYNQSNDLSLKTNWHNNQRNYLLDQRMERGRSLGDRGILLQNAFSTRSYLDNPFVRSQQCGMDGNGGESVIDSLNVGDGVIIQGRDLKYGIDNKGHDSFKCHKKKSLEEIAMQNLQEKSSKLDKIHGGNVTLMPSPYSLVEFQGCIYYMAKDQNGCRLLQRIFDEGRCLYVQIIFNEIIDNIVELMMDPFGNYLVQKLLDVCTEEQRLQIVLMVTKEAGQLVRISLNTYGTRVVQKLIETLKSRQQISLIKSALKPGILDLIKDLNGNHVLQRCLQCLDNEDNKIIFDAASKFCVDIATHRHGCCVLQHCIAHSNGQHRDKLITRISKNGLLLAQDPFGNYVVQYIIGLKVPSAIGNLLSQFKGHFVQLSMQKFSSHVVEKCLKHFAESRSQIVRELISVVHFEQLLQDPFANYVIQSALAVTKGPLHASLVEAVRPHTILRTNPYCKRIFSRNLLKK
ncbi:putative pumilio homolog 7, chloroplastic isoform X2 [Durio zibethinus]|uniref:Pumilio homolog 7, chloroplastic isoform X2 n=1 Tax=Durio zibethinus TaxID=66656 RepID=A0A6P6B5X1_DURZI|nr:putative pumilio homolog 7, chloroplastic isoform X2 [Durio zibethinus]